MLQKFRNIRMIDRVLCKQQLEVWFQPLVDLNNQSVFAYEALARPTSETGTKIVDLFQRAVQVGRVGELGRMLRRMAVERCPDAPLFLNVHPDELTAGWLTRADDPIYDHKHTIFLEVTESVPMKYLAVCQKVLTQIRQRGVKLAVDDLGSGYSNLRYILDLHPEIVKFDQSLIQGMVANTRQHQLVCSLVNLCIQLDARVVAEGIETAEEYAAVLEAGAHFGQGYYLGRPQSTPRPGSDD